MSFKKDYVVIDMFHQEKIEVIVHSLKKIIPENILLTIYREAKENYEPMIKVDNQIVSRNICIKME